MKRTCSSRASRLRRAWRSACVEQGSRFGLMAAGTELDPAHDALAPVIEHACVTGEMDAARLGDAQQLKEVAAKRAG